MIWVTYGSVIQSTLIFSKQIRDFNNANVPGQEQKSAILKCRNKMKQRGLGPSITRVLILRLTAYKSVPVVPAKKIYCAVDLLEGSTLLIAHMPVLVLVG
jgi:hypothetical protein